ncbi:hypothetical protein N8076_00115 [Gammaproteobacteria bacterium]|nr:hypothetical protein [Gammaproteobacteria bacterium]
MGSKDATADTIETPDTLVPMHTKVTASQDLLYSLLFDQPLPPDDEKHHFFLAPKLLNRQSSNYSLFNDLLSSCIDDAKGNRGPKQIASLQHHFHSVLLTLSWAMYRHQWVLIALDKGAYSKDYWLKRYGFSYVHTRVVVDYLESKELITRKVGKRYSGKPTRTRIYPTELLQRTLWRFFLDSEQPIEPPYVSINEPEGRYGEVIANLDEGHPDLVDMTKINEFLKGHQWACKAPVRLVYKHNPFTSGRLITPYQGLPDRKIRLRINTLIDGQPICEVDFNANHLRLNLAVMALEDAGETPYEDICELAGIDDRQRIKNYVTRAMGADSRDGAKGACLGEGITHKQFDVIEAAVLKRYPKVSLYTGFGVNAQSLEGQILKQVMLEGVDKGIVALPVHDAVAVTQDNAEWAKEAMLKAWFEHTNSRGSVAKSRVKVDYPAPLLLRA